MKKSDSQHDILDSLKSAKAIAILLPPNPAFEVVAAGVTLYLAHKEAGRDVEIACPSPMVVDVSEVVGVDKVKTKLPSRNLVISFDYVEGAVEKVSWNPDNNKFNLVVQPKADHPPLSKDHVEYSYQGVKPDLVILVGTTSKDNIKEVFWSDKDGDHQTLSVIASEGKTLTAEALALIQGVGLNLTPDAASNLYRGLVRETDQFKTAGSDDFDTAAKLLRLGAENVLKRGESKKEVTAPEEPHQDWVGPKIFRSSEGTNTDVV